jgi:hypothetical protein
MEFYRPLASERWRLTMESAFVKSGIFWAPFPFGAALLIVLIFVVCLFLLGRSQTNWSVSLGQIVWSLLYTTGITLAGLLVVIGFEALVYAPYELMNKAVALGAEKQRAIDTKSGSTRTKCLSASWNVSGWSEMGLASGIAYLDCAHIRGAYGLSGIGILPTAAELDEQFLSPVAALHARELLPPPPQPAITNTNMNIRAPIIFSIKSPFAGTVIETDRPCPQLGNWPYLAEAGGGKGADGRRLTY